MLLAVDKVSSDPAFIAYYFRHIKYPWKVLGCSRLRYCKLALCLVPRNENGLRLALDYAGVRNYEPKFFGKIFLDQGV